jgi:hypothetical protein
MTVRKLIRQPSAWLPLVLSLGALATVVGHVTVFGAAREPDEGAAAHIFQWLMIGQAPIAALFLIKWLPRCRTQALAVFTLQVGAAAAALAPVWYLGL